MTPVQIEMTLPPELLDEIIALVAVRVRAEMQREVDDGPEWLSVESAARYLDVSPERVRKLIARRAIPHYQDWPGCRVFLRRRELDDWMSRSRIAAHA